MAQEKNSLMQLPEQPAEPIIDLDLDQLGQVGGGGVGSGGTGGGPAH